MDNSEKEMINIYNKAGTIKEILLTRKEPNELMGIMLSIYDTNKKLDILIKQGLYSLTNEAIKKRLKEDFELSDDEIKELKNKKELVDKLVELM